MLRILLIAISVLALSGGCVSLAMLSRRAADRVAGSWPVEDERLPPPWHSLWP